MLACGVNGCVRESVKDVAAIWACYKSFQKVIISADNCMDTDVFQSDYNKFLEYCGDDHGSEDGTEEDFLVLFEKTLNELLKSSDCVKSSGIDDDVDDEISVDISDDE